MSMRRPPTDQTPIATAADLTARWDAYLAHEPFRFRALWLMFLDPAGRPTGPVMTIDRLPDGPYDIDPQDVVLLCRGILDGPGGEGSVAMLISRDGGAPWTVSDRAWGRFLLLCTEAIGGRTWPVHRANRKVLEIFVLPEVASRG